MRFLMFATLSTFTLFTLLIRAATLPSGVVIIVPPNTTVVTEEVSFGASFASGVDSDMYGFSSRMQIALSYPNGTHTTPATLHDRACTDSPPNSLAGFNIGGLNFSQRVIPDAPGVYTIDVSVRFGFPPSGSKCADGNEEFQFQNLTTSFQVQPLPASVTSSYLIGTAFGLVTKEFAQPTRLVEGTNIVTPTPSAGNNTNTNMKIMPTNEASSSAPILTGSVRTCQLTLL